MFGFFLFLIDFFEGCVGPAFSESKVGMDVKIGCGRKIDGQIDRQIDR